MSLKSMTGIGVAHSNSGQIVVKSVNGRGLDIRFRWPRTFLSLEEIARSLVKKVAYRGSLEVSFLENQGHSAILEQDFVAYCQSVGFAPPAYRDFIAYESGRALPIDYENLSNQINQAVETWNSKRTEEGSEICIHLQDQLQKLKILFSSLQQAEHLLTEKLKSRIPQFLEQLQAPGIDETRLHQEIAIIRDRHDVLEEVTRLNLGLQLFEKILVENGPHGKRLEFTLQEIHREITTLANKIYVSDFQEQIVEFKTIVEQMKEQVLNVE